MIYKDNASEWEQAEIDYWEAAAEQIKPEILEEITKPPPPTLKERFIEWVNKPRGTQAIIAAQGQMMSDTIRILQGRE